jgi:hypothetical protein
MTIEEAVYSVLSGAAGVTALVPAGRIKPEGVYQGIRRPYIRHFAVSVEPIHTHDQGMVELKNWPYQVSIFAETPQSLTDVRTAVMAALDASASPKFFLRGMVRLETPVDSTDTPVIGQGLLLDAWYE